MTCTFWIDTAQLSAPFSHTIKVEVSLFVCLLNFGMANQDSSMFPQDDILVQNLKNRVGLSTQYLLLSWFLNRQGNTHT